MHNDHHLPPKKPELNELLKSWEAPEAPASLHRRILSDYRQQVTQVPFWKKLFTFSVRIPMPLILAQAVLLLVTGAALMSSFATQKAANVPVLVTNKATNNITSNPKPEIIEVPVIQEKIVTKIVYASPRIKPRIKFIALAPTQSETVTVSGEIASQVPATGPEANRLITPNLRAIRSAQLPELPTPKQNFAETAFISDSPFTILARNNFDLPATLFARPTESSPLKFSKIASSTTGFMMKMIDNKSTRMMYRFGGRTKTFAEEAILNRILFRSRIDPNWTASFGDSCAPAGH